jgi:hypothetical protein
MTSPVETPGTHYVPQGLPTSIQHYINGQFVDSVGGATFDVLDPVSNRNYARRRTSTSPSPLPGRPLSTARGPG